jgi:membrane protease subunit HflK
VRLLPLLAIIALGLWLASGIYVVNPGEQGVVRQFGREIGKSAPGLNYHFPDPIQSVDVVNVQAIRRIEVGFRTDRGRVPAEALMLTGDENIVDTQLIVQYRVRDPSLFLFRMRDPEGSLHQAAQVAIRSVVGNTTIEDVLTTGRAQAQVYATGYIQTLMDQYESGLLITEVRLQVVDPPEQVKDAFNEVVRAREDRERQQNEAQAYMEDIVPKARGEAEQVIRAADAFRQERVLQAQGDVARFRAVLDEYRKGKDVTRERLYLETIERVLGKVGKVVVDRGVGDRTLPLLPLNDLVRGNGQTPPQTAPAEPPQPPAQPQPQQQQQPQQPSAGPTPAPKPSR